MQIPGTTKIQHERDLNFTVGFRGVSKEDIGLLQIRMRNIATMQMASACHTNGIRVLALSSQIIFRVMLSLLVWSMINNLALQSFLEPSLNRLGVAFVMF